MGVRLVCGPPSAAAAIIAAAAPDLPADRAALLLRYCRWSFALDDRIDGVRHPPAPGAPTAAQLGVADLTVELADIVARFRGMDPDGLITGRFRKALGDVVSAGRAQMRLARAYAAGRCQLPNADAFLDLAGRSVNFRSFAWALLLVQGEAIGAVDAARIESALWPGARAVRLANDLRTAARDRCEGGLNVLMLRARDGAPVTRDWVTAEIAEQARWHDALLEPLADRPCGGMLRRSLRLALHPYDAADIGP
jgi:hypothetical protein